MPMKSVIMLTGNAATPPYLIARSVFHVCTLSWLQKQVCGNWSHLCLPCTSAIYGDVELLI